MTSVASHALVVLQAFGPYTRGELLTDPTIISAILAGGHASHVVQTRLVEHTTVGVTTAGGR